MKAERMLETASLHWFGILQPIGAPVLRSDHGLSFQSYRVRQACRNYRFLRAAVSRARRLKPCPNTMRNKQLGALIGGEHHMSVLYYRKVQRVLSVSA